MKWSCAAWAENGQMLKGVSTKQRDLEPGVESWERRSNDTAVPLSLTATLQRIYPCIYAVILSRQHPRA